MNIPQVTVFTTARRIIEEYSAFAKLVFGPVERSLWEL